MRLVRLDMAELQTLKAVGSTKSIQPIDSNELIEIELPSAPAFDWWFWGELFLLLLVAVLIAWIVFSVRRQFLGSLKAQYQLNRQLVKIKNTTNKLISRADCLKINQVFVNLKQNKQLDTHAAETLTTRFNEACFGPQPVSRETFISLLSDLLLELKK